MGAEGVKHTLIVLQTHVGALISRQLSHHLQDVYPEEGRREKPLLNN